jgi:hypothetical protein
MFVYLQGKTYIYSTSILTDSFTFKRNICQEYGFVNNARVVVIEFGRNSICVETLDKKRKRLSLPRIKFKFRVAYGQSYTMIRLQYPLKLGKKVLQILFIITNNWVMLLYYI